MIAITAPRILGFFIGSPFQGPTYLFPQSLPLFLGSHRPLGGLKYGSASKGQLVFEDDPLAAIGIIGNAV